MTKKRKARFDIATPSEETISAEARKQAVSIVSVGCSRSAAAKFLGLTLSELEQLVRNDKQFARELDKAEASVEIKHMQSVLKSADEKTDWRKSIWWLENMRSSQYGKQSATARENKRIDSFLQAVVDAIALEIHDIDTRSRLLDRLSKLREE